MNNSKNLIDKLAKLLEQGMITSKDLGDEVKNILKFKQEEIINKLNFVTKEEFEVQKLRLDQIEKKINKKKKLKR
tara:strand:- start:1459 stop:1683 length:225 start_codon:yes stop_codon:yes gene_type:complete